MVLFGANLRLGTRNRSMTDIVVSRQSARPNTCVGRLERVTDTLGRGAPKPCEALAPPRQAALKEVASVTSRESVVASAR